MMTRKGACDARLISIGDTVCYNDIWGIVPLPPDPLPNKLAIGGLFSTGNCSNSFKLDIIGSFLDDSKRAHFCIDIEKCRLNLKDTY